MRDFLFILTALFALALVQQVYGQCVNTTEGLCNLQGTCVPRANGTAICKCNDAYGNANCTYKRKSQITDQAAKGGWGAERFYLALYGSAAGKLVLGICSCLVPCIMICAAGGLGFSGKEGGSAAVTIFGTLLAILLSMAIFAWWLADVILTGTNKLKDHNGYKPKPW